MARRLDHPLFAGAVCALFFALCSRADTVVLINGQTLEGRVSDEGEIVKVELAQGAVKLRRSQIKSITSKQTPLDEYARRSEEIEKRSTQEKLENNEQADLWYALAQWASANQLPRAKAEALRKAIELNPDHANARQEAGFVRHNGRWATIAERNQELGLVLVSGKWVPKEAQKELQEIREQKKADEDRADSEQRARDAEAQRDETARALRDLQNERAAYYRPRFVAPYFMHYEPGLFYYSSPVGSCFNYQYLAPGPATPAVPVTPGTNNPTAGANQQKKPLYFDRFNNVSTLGPSIR